MITRSRDFQEFNNLKKTKLITINRKCEGQVHVIRSLCYTYVELLISIFQLYSNADLLCTFLFVVIVMFIESTSKTVFVH